jgi:hypothetical protein
VIALERLAEDAHRVVMRDDVSGPRASISAAPFRARIASRLRANARQRASSTTPRRRPCSVRRRSALSSRSCSRYSARDVNIRYGSVTPRVMRSSTSTPRYASSRRGHQPSSLPGEAPRVDARENALRRRFLVAGGAVDLPGEEEARDGLGLQRRLERAGIEVVVFDRVAWRRMCALSQPGSVRTSACCTSNGSDVEMPFG